jgi:RNA polymerase sigma factor (sigma-70 family)
MKERKYPELEGSQVLLEKVKAGDNDSFTPVYDFYKKRVFGYVRARSYLHPEDAEDMSQEVFLKAFLAVKNGNYDVTRPLGGYLIRIAKNVMIDNSKRKKQPLTDDNPPDVPDYVDTHDMAVTNETLGKTINAIKELPEPSRSIVGQSVFLSQAEVAEKVGESRNFVHNRLHDIREELRKIADRPRRVWFRGEAGF